MKLYVGLILFHFHYTMLPPTKTVAKIQSNGALHVIGVESPYSHTRESITRQKHEKPA